MAGSEKSLSPEIIKLTEKMARDPSSRLFVPLAEEYMKCGMTDEAFMVLTDGLKNHPSYVGAHVSLAKLLWQVGKKAEAKREFEEVASANPDNVLAHRYLVQLYREDGQLDQALSSCRMILNLNPKDPEMQKVLGELEENVSPAKEEKGESQEMGEVSFGEVDLTEPRGNMGVGITQEGDLGGEPGEALVESSTGNEPAQSETPDTSFLTETKPSEEIPSASNLPFTGLKEEILEPSLSSKQDESKVENPLDFPETAIPERPSLDSSSGEASLETEAPFNFPKEEGLFNEKEAQGSSLGGAPFESSINLDLEEPSPQVGKEENQVEIPEQQDESVIEISEDSEVDLKSLEDAFTSFSEEEPGKIEKKGLAETEEPLPVPSLETDEKSMAIDSPVDVNEHPVEKEPPGVIAPEPEKNVESLEKDDFDTESLAELYVRQGYYDKGIEIYRKLLLSDPSNQGLKQKIDDAVTLASLLTGKDHGEVSGQTPVQDRSFSPAPEQPESHVQGSVSPTPLVQEEGKGKSHQSDPKSVKIQRLQAWLSNIRKG